MPKPTSPAPLTPEERERSKTIAEAIYNVFFRPILIGFTAGLEAGRAERTKTAKPKRNHGRHPRR